MTEDLISRAAAIEALKQLQKSITGDYTELDPLVMAGCGYIGDCIGELECLPSAQPDLQPNLQPTCNWIPVTERLPELYEKVLACVDGRIYIDERELRGWRYRVTEYDAWMPLPEPYEGGEQDE